MLRELMLLGACAGAAHTWLSAVTSPLLAALRRSMTDHAAAARQALALAVAGAVAWTIIAVGGGLLFLMLEPALGLALLDTHAAAAAFAFGAVAWVVQALAANRAPRLGATFEVATALAIVALVRDDPATLRRVEGLYRTYALDQPAAAVPLRHALAARTPSR